MDGSSDLIHEIAHAATSGHFEFPLRQLSAAQDAGGETTAQAVLPIGVACRKWVGAEGLEAATGIGCRLGAEITPALGGIGSGEAQSPLVTDGRRRDIVTAFRTQGARASPWSSSCSGPVSPVASSGSARILAVARHSTPPALDSVPGEGEPDGLGRADHTVAGQQHAGDHLEQRRHNTAATSATVTAPPRNTLGCFTQAMSIA